MFILYHLVGVQPQIVGTADDEDKAKELAKAHAENHPGREVFVATPLGSMTAPQTTAVWGER